MARSHRHIKLAREEEHRWPHGWWILPGAILGAFVWVSIIRRVVEALWGVK